jgi:Glycosyl transferase family 21
MDVISITLVVRWLIGWGLMWRLPRLGVAFGPAMATSKEDYDRIGGHDAVAGYVVEDWFMAHVYESAGLPVSAYMGHAVN